MPDYLAPAVYVEEVSFRAPSIEGVGTTTTAFAGPTLTGPVGVTPQLLTSFGDFQSTYGGFDQLSLVQNGPDPKNTNFVALSVKGFFDNGGSMLYVSRVFSQGSDSGNASATLSSGNVQITVNARFPGAFANFQTVTVNLVATKTTLTNLANLPTGSVVALAAPVPAGTAPAASLAAVAGPAATTITIAAALSGKPAFVLIDDEILGVTTAAGTALTVTRGQFGTAAAQHSAGAAVFTPLGTLESATAVDASTLTLAAAFTGPDPVAVQVGSDELTVTAVNAQTLTVSPPAAAAHNLGDPVFATMYVAYYTNGNSTTFKSGANPLGTPVPSYAALYVLTMSVTTYGAASLKVTVPTVQQAMSYSGLGFDAQYHPNYLGATLGDSPPRPIDALQNQIAFVVSTTGTPPVAPVALLTALFGTWGGPGTTASQPFVLAGGDDGVEPQSIDYDNALTPVDGLEDVAIVATPGSAAFDQSEAIIDTLITHVSKERAYRIAVLDAPFGGLAADYENVRAQIDSSYAALYVPWVKMANPLAKTGTAIPSYVYVPPSGFIAGIYARSDEANSVAKAPANEVVLDAIDFERRITFAEQATLNPLGINCLRYFPDRGYLVWGARTASSDSEFMYVNVRRYLIYLEHSIDISTQWAVFENNGPALWARVKDAIDSFLNNEYVSGNLLGTSPATSYFIRCDRTTMTQNDLDNGRMICLIGVSVLKPAEFVIFRIGQWTASAPS